MISRKKIFLLWHVIFLTCNNSCDCIYIYVYAQNTIGVEDPHYTNAEVNSKHEYSCWSLGKGLRLTGKKAVNIHHPISPRCRTELHFLFLCKILKRIVMVKDIDRWCNLQRSKITFVPSQERAWKATVKELEHEDRKKRTASKWLMWSLTIGNQFIWVFLGNCFTEVFFFFLRVCVCVGLFVCSIVCCWFFVFCFFFHFSILWDLLWDLQWQKSEHKRVWRTLFPEMETLWKTRWYGPFLNI